MSIDNIMFANEFNIDKVEYGEVKKLGDGAGGKNVAKMVPVNYDKKPLVLQTCEMYAPFGLNTFAGDDGKADAYSIDLSFRDMETRDCLKELYQMMSALDERNLRECVDVNSMEWLGKKRVSRDVVEALYTPVIKMAKDKETREPTDKYPATFKVKLPTTPNGFKCTMFDAKHDPMDIISTNLKGAKITALIQCTGIWLAGGKFGMTWKMIQLQAIPRIALDGYCIRPVAMHGIVESEDSEVVDMLPLRKELDQIKPNTKPGLSDVVDSEEEDDEEEEEEEEEDEEEEEEKPKQMAVPKKRNGSKK